MVVKLLWSYSAVTNARWRLCMQKQGPVRWFVHLFYIWEYRLSKLDSCMVGKPSTLVPAVTHGLVCARYPAGITAVWYLDRYSDSLRDGRFGGRIPVGARFSAPVQTGPGAHPASYTEGTGSLPRVKRPEPGVDHPPHLAPRLKKEYSCTSIPPLGLRDLF